jgi:hypothetical protein
VEDAAKQEIRGTRLVLTWRQISPESAGLKTRLGRPTESWPIARRF